MGRENSNWKVSNHSKVFTTKYISGEEWAAKNERTGKFVKYLVLKEPDYVEVIGLDANGNIILIEQDHIASGRGVQAVAGRIEEDESPEKAARREFIEETGWSAGKVYPMGRAVPQSNRFVSLTTPNEAKTAHLFIASDCTAGPRTFDGAEDIKPIIIPFNTAMDCVASGAPLPKLNLRIDDMGTQLLLLKLWEHQRLFPSIKRIP